MAVERDEIRLVFSVFEEEDWRGFLSTFFILFFPKTVTGWSR